MKATIIVAVALAAGASGRVIEARQRGGKGPDVEKCGLDAFVGHTSEALLFCSSLLQSGTATRTATITAGETTTVRTTKYTTLYPPTTTPKPPTSTPTTTPKPPTSTPTTTPKPPTSSTPTTTPKPPTSSTPTTTPAPSPTAGCGIVGYTKDTAAYFFDSSGTKNTFAACSAACKADAQCKSFGYGEANCMLFTVDAASNTNYNPMSPYTFYDVSCPKELPVRKRQVTISLGFGGPGPLSSACSCLITSGPAGITRTTSTTITNRVTTTQTVTRTVSLLPGMH